MSRNIELVKVYYVLIGDSVLGYCKTMYEAEEWVSDLKGGIFKKDSKYIGIIEDWAESDFYDDY